MEKYLRLHRNWRANAILIMALIALLLLCSEADSTCLLIATKVAGIAITSLCFKMGRRWHRAGKLQEIDDIADEEE